MYKGKTRIKKVYRLCLKGIIFVPALIASILLGFNTHKELATCIQKFQEAKNLIETTYVDSIPDSTLIHDALNGLLSRLDPYTWYIPQDQFQKISERLENSYVGIGIYTLTFNDTVYISHVIPHSPAYRAGIEPGDQILSIDGIALSGYNTEKKNLTRLLRGTIGSTVCLKLKRKKRKKVVEITANIKRENITTTSILSAFLANENTGVIKLHSFARSTFNEMRYHLQLLQAQGMQNLILDLRNNGGGYLEACNNLADMFLKEGQVIVKTQGRIPQHTKTYYATSTINDFESGNLVILINENSASASELLAGAIQDNDRGLVLGRCSIGKGLVQNQYILQDRSAIRITVAKYFTPSGRKVQKPYTHKKIHNSLTAPIQSLEELSPKVFSQLPDSLKFYTQKGRKITSAGGILPDIYLPPDSTLHPPLLKEIVRKNLFDIFILQNLSEIGNLSKKYSSIRHFQNQYELPSQLIRKFIVFAANTLQKKHTCITAEIAKEKIELYLRACLAWIYFGPPGYHELNLPLDSELQKAIEIVNSTLAMERLNANATTIQND